METNVERTKTPGHGRSEVKGSLRIWKASSRGNPQELLEYVPLCAYVELEYSNPYCFGTASKYLTIRPSNPPTLTNPTNDNDPSNARRVFQGRRCFVYRFYVPIIAKTTEPVNMMMVCKVSVKMTAARPPTIINRSNFTLNTGHRTISC